MVPTIGEGRGATAPSSSSLATFPQGDTGADVLGLFLLTFPSDPFVDSVGAVDALFFSFFVVSSRLPS